MKKQQVDYDPDELLNSTGIDWGNYKEKRLSQDQIEAATTLVYDDSEMKSRALRLIEDCRVYYDNNLPAREKRMECVDFYKGEHWNGLMTDPDTGETITQKQHILNQNMVPLKQNQIRQIIKNMLGQFRDNEVSTTVISRNREKQKFGEMMTKALQYALQLNDSRELDVRIFEEFLLSGMFGWKTSFGLHSERNERDVMIDPIHPMRFFFNTGISDPRLKEINVLGELLDMPIDAVIKNFAKNDEDAALIRQWYGMEDITVRNQRSYGMNYQDSSMVENIDFQNPTDPNMCRVFEIWEKINMKLIIAHDGLTGKSFQTEKTAEELEQINQMRIQEAMANGVPEENIPLIDYEVVFEDVWHFWFLTDRGDILMHGETPFDHEQTPYTVGLYPLVDGNIWGMAWDVLDQQKQINRLLTMLDKIMGASAKGVLMIPEDAIPDGWTEQDFAEEWTKSNGVIVYKPSKTTNAKPEQISANSSNIGAVELLQVQFNLLREISGVNDSIQGQKPNAGTTASQYAQQTNNASLNNKDYFDFFFARRKLRDFKIVKLQQQFYDEDRNIVLSGKDWDDEISTYIASEAKDLDIDMALGNGSNSSAYRQMAEEQLWRLLEGQLIDLDIFLQNSSMPFADKLRESMNKRQEELQEAQQQGQQGDPRAMQMLEQYAGMGGMPAQGMN